MKSTLFIKYSENSSGGNGFDLVALGESFIGFNNVLEDLFDIAEIEGELEVRTQKIENGSVIIHLVLEVFSQVPFEKIQDLYNYLQVVDQQLYQKALEYFSAIGHGHKTVNDFVAQNPVDFAVGTYLANYFRKMIVKAKKQKAKIDTENDTFPLSYAQKLQKMIHQNKFKKMLKPIAEEQIGRITFSQAENFEEAAVIDESNFDNYLGEEAKILPEYLNGVVYEFTGEIVALQSSRGETLKFRADNIIPAYQLLVAYPPDDKTTEDYLDFYKKKVLIKAEVFRKSEYQKPKVLLKDIQLQQLELPMN